MCTGLQANRARPSSTGSVHAGSMHPRRARIMCTALRGCCCARLRAASSGRRALHPPARPTLPPAAPSLGAVGAWGCTIWIHFEPHLADRIVLPAFGWRLCSAMLGDVLRPRRPGRYGWPVDLHDPSRRQRSLLLLCALARPRLRARSATSSAVLGRNGRGMRYARVVQDGADGPNRGRSTSCEWLVPAPQPDGGRRALRREDDLDDRATLWRLRSSCLAHLRDRCARHSAPPLRSSRAPRCRPSMP